MSKKRNMEMKRTDNPEKQIPGIVEATDYQIDGVTYQVMSVFQGERDLEESLSDLMLRELQAEEQDETPQELTMKESTDEEPSIGIA